MASSEMIVTIDMKNLDEVKDYVASLELQLADVTAKRDALMDCFFEFETVAPNGELMASVLDMHKRLESLESQLAEARDENVKLKTDLEQMNNYADEMHQSVLDWELQLAEAKARLAGFDPATKLPEFGTKVLVETPLLGGYSSFDFATYRVDNTWQSETTAYRELRGITRWFPLPSAPKEEDE